MPGFVPGIISGGGSGFAVWSIVNKSNNINISGSNLTFTGVNSTLGCGVATLGKSAGKWYWEILINSKANQAAILGLWSGVLPISTNSTQLGVTGGTVGWNGNGAGGRCVSFSNVPQGTGCTAQTSGQVIGIALDLDNHTCAFRVNNLLNYTVTGLAVTTWYPACGSSNANPGDSGTANFGATPFVYTPPSGFNPGVF
jgi:hypothetical protein